MAVPVIESTATYEDGANTTSTSISKPSGFTTGDWLVLIVGCDGNSSITASDFTQISRQIDPDDSCNMYLGVRKYTGTEGSTFTISYGSSETGKGWIGRISGIDSSATAADIIDSFSCARAQPMGSTRVFAPGFYNETADALIIACYTMDNGIANTGTTGTPSGYTSSYQDAGVAAGVGMSVAYKSGGAAGYVDRTTFTPSAATDAYVCFHFSLKSTLTKAAYPAQPILKCLEYQMNLVLTGQIGLDLPYGTVQNDLLIFQGAIELDHFSIDADFTQIQKANTGAAIYVGAWYSVVDASPPTNYLFTTASSSGKQVALARFINVDTTTPINTSSIASGTTDAAPTCSTITPSVNNCFILYSFGADDDDLTFNSGYFTGKTPIFSFPSTTSADTSFQWAYETQTTAAATGSVSATLNLSEEWVAIAVAIAPAVAATAVVGGPMQNMMAGFIANYGGQGFIAQGIQTTETGT